jgi:hypothetical protein
MARPLAAHLTAWSETLFAQARLGMLSAVEINRLLQGEIARLRSKYTAMAAGDILDGTRAAEARQDRIAAAAYALCAARGVKVELSEADRERLQQAEGLSPAEIDEITPFLAGLLEASLLPPPPGKLVRLLRAQGIAETPVNLAQAERIDLRANSIALREQANIYEEAVFVDDAAHLGAAAKRAAESDPAAAGKSGPASAGNSTSAPQARAPSSATPVTPEKSHAPKASLSTLGEKLIAERVRDKRWKKETGAEVRATLNLFRKFIGHDDLMQVDQRALSDFKDFTKEIPKNYGKSEKDRLLTADQLREKGRNLAENKRGIGPDALNKHLNYLAQLFEHVRAQGIKLAELKPGALRARQTNDAMDEVLPWTFEQRDKIYRHSVFTGSRDLKHRHELGDTIYHDGLFWCPLLSDYESLRREEAAGLAVDDVARDEETGIWYVHVRRNEFRDIKRPWTARKIPLHPELMRLNFIDYVENIRALGYRALFPDLAPARAGAPFGEQLNDGWTKIEQTVFPEGKPERTAFRSWRHSFNSGLKNKRVASEMRAELMGHKRTSETEGRYGDRFNLPAKLAALEQIPVATNHLEPREIRLLPAIANKQRMRTARRPRKDPNA